ncbi:ribose 5-phosphate isomerase B [Spiroplasma tabanidicola]|uniref:Ribose-5-phosphate isomerase B n=1 Tax=Spiroplasma tabanidicola TaxID=324079 RepID=A0A6I6C6T9_9MOLU|nr:ribose 5-phosphate isomerase B [Spiroplasma tabanidicola]QGS51496.1 ribose-5-phosphate isomerase B [Spiroplasma tabanidicola]
MKIYIGNDHTAVEMKNSIVNYLLENGYEVENLGVDTSDPSDYPDLGHNVANKVANDKYSKGIIICGTGIGISIAANKVKGIRAALCYEIETTKMARKHNDANILALGARIIANQKAILLVEEFLKTDFEGGRHQNRINKIDTI